MNANRIKIVKDDIDKFVNIPISMQWDFMGRDDSISEYEIDAIKQVTGAPIDFEISRFAGLLVTFKPGIAIVCPASFILKVIILFFP